MIFRTFIATSIKEAGRFSFYASNDESKLDAVACSALSNVELDDILVVENVIPRHRLAVKDARAPDAGGFQLVREITMD